ncbi:MAG: hypothetical protein HRU19_14065 [Pseudobacteriovorax sp.]|nr:hypothetical protein [Pseudobacteriovorax sp.]
MRHLLFIVLGLSLSGCITTFRPLPVHQKRIIIKKHHGGHGHYHGGHHRHTRIRVR